MDICHEIAHIILHKGVETGDVETEKQANYFASLFLLPQQALIQGYTSKSRTRLDWKAISALKIKWGISSKAIIYRLNQNGIISPTQYSTASIYLSKTGQTKNEYYDDRVPNDLPELLPTSLTMLSKTYGKTLGGLLDKLGINLEFLAELTQFKDVVGAIIQEANFADNVTSINTYKNSHFTWSTKDI